MDVNYRKIRVSNMSNSTSEKNGRSVGLSKAIALALVMLLVGVVVGVALSVAVIAPIMENQHQNNDQGNTGDQNNGQNGNQPNNGIQNNNSPPGTPTGNYAGNGQFSITMTQNGNTASGTIQANINCQVQQNGDSITFSMNVTPTSVSQGLQQAISTGNTVTFNFEGNTSGSQLTASASGSAGDSTNFNMQLSGSIDQNQMVFSIQSAPGSQLSISSGQITLHQNNP
jgi:hypothetical protein